MSNKTASKKKTTPAKENKSLGTSETNQKEKGLTKRHNDLDKTEPVKFMVSRTTDSGAPCIVPTEGNYDLVNAKFAEALGTPDSDLQTHLLEQARGVFKRSSSDNKLRKSVDILNQIMAFLGQFQPRNEVEALLAVQMMGIHNLSMECMRQAMLEGQTFEGCQSNINLATKMTRTFVAQMAALKNHREGGKQKMTVEHVHVNDGGQAIVGDVKGGG